MQVLNLGDDKDSHEHEVLIVFWFNFPHCSTWWFPWSKLHLRYISTLVMPWWLASTGTQGRSPRRCPRRRSRRGPRSSLSWRLVLQNRHLENNMQWFSTKDDPCSWILVWILSSTEKLLFLYRKLQFETPECSVRWSTTTTWCPPGTPLTSALIRPTWTRSCWRCCS